ncbi:MAG: alpha/beta fold hydrolase [Acidobacteriota bacterium]
MTGRRTWATAVVMIVSAAGAAHAAGRAAQFRNSDGVSIAATVYDAAIAPAPAVVLVHMLTRTKEDWQPFAQRLQAAGFTAVTIDLRGHGQSSGAAAPAAAMALDVQAALTWLTERSDVTRGAVATVGASLGASLALLAAADVAAVRGAALLSPAADYRGVRLDAALKKYGARPMLLVASNDDPYALRTVRALAANHPEREQRLSPVAAHGSQLLARDPDVAAALVDWLRRTLLS